jgi:hypothetical protein
MIPSGHQSHRMSRVPFPRANHPRPPVEGRLLLQGGYHNRVPSLLRQSLRHGHFFPLHRRDPSTGDATTQAASQADVRASLAE